MPPARKKKTTSRRDGARASSARTKKNPRTNKKARAEKATRTKTTTRKVHRSRKPADMSIETWQIALRRDFAQQQEYHLENLGDHAFFSEFRVTNPSSGGVYDVTTRGQEPGENYCTCPDFAINTLGTCKHIEFVLQKLRRKRGGRAALEAGFIPEQSEIYLRYDARRDVIFRPGQNMTPKLRRLVTKYFDARGRLKDGAFGRFETLLSKAQEAGTALRCHEDVLDFVARVRDRDAVRNRIDRAFARGADSTEFRRLLQEELYPYQRHGALFAARAGRCLIADDMGLGKTVQAVAAAEILAKHGSVERVLIICPTSLKHQWAQEIERFAGLKSDVIEGLQPRREELYALDSIYKITNYDVVYRDLEAIQSWGPDLVILDEAQRIKNWRTRTAQSVKRIDSTFSIVLTGTPLENRLEELHSIVEFVDRDRLGPSFRFLHEHQHIDDTGRVIGYRNLGKIAETLEPILVRRTRNQVLSELPERLEKRLFVPMTEQQLAHHEEYREAVARIVAKWKRWGYLSDVDQRRLMSAMQGMRMACNSTYLIDQTTDFGHKADELVDLLSEILEDPRAKVVIFTQWVRMQEIITRRLKQRQWTHVVFNGSVPAAKRNDLVQRFREEADCRLFLSTDAGGVGLNLQHASVVINIDQPWNPAVLEQRVGRVHRLGQHRPVRVIHLIARGTIEEGMLRLIRFKQSMFEGVLDGGADEVFLGGTKLKRFMESVDRMTTDLPEPAPAEEPQPDAASVADADEQVPFSRGGGADRGAGAALAAGRGTAEGTSPEAWSHAIEAGLDFLEKLSSALQGDGSATRGVGPRTAGSNSKAKATLDLNDLVRRRSSGERYLEVPLPSEEAMQRLSQILANLSSVRR